jgi:hypothetical protein
MMPVAPPGLIAGAVRSPLPYGLLSTFAVRAGAADRWEAGVQFDTGVCAPAGGIGAWECEPPQYGLQVITLVDTQGLTWWTISYGDETTAHIGPDPIAGEVRDPLLALNAFRPGDFTVTGSQGGPFSIRFRDGKDWGQLSVDSDGGMVSIVRSQPNDTQGTFGLPKTLTGGTGDSGLATPFTVYGHYACSPIGRSLSAAQDLATAHLMEREEARVEQAFWTGDLSNVPNLVGSATDITPVGGSPNAAGGVALLEQFIATNYGSLGVIHMTRAAATMALADDVLTTSGSRLTTKLGTPVAAGAGYPGTGPQGEVPAEAATWMYASPALFGYRSEVFTSSARPGDLLALGTNDLTAIAERSYLIGFDPCGVAAVLVEFADVPEPPQ